MATQSLKYDLAIKYLLDGTVDLDTDTIRVALLTSAYNPRPGAAAWVAATVYAVNTIIISGGRYYEAIVGGTSSGALPFFNTTAGSITTDSTVTWYSWGYAPPSAHGVWADVSANEISGTGYTAGGVALAGKAVTLSAHGAIFSANTAGWTSALFTARYAVIYKNGTANAVVNPLLCYVLLDDTNIDVGIPVLGAFNLAWPAAGIFAIN